MNKTKIIQDIIVSLIGISNNLEALAETLNASIVPENTETVEKEPAKDEASESKQPTLEEVREAMAEKSKAGHREEVKAILSKYDAKKLTSLDEKHYADVLKEVGEIK